MKRRIKGLLLLILITQGCNKSEIDEHTPSPEYPYVYSKLSIEKMATAVQNFNAINSIESLTLNEFGILSGYVPVDLSNGIDSLIVKENISMIVNTYAHFLGISNPESINIETEVSIRTIGGVTVPVKYYFTSEESAYPVFSLNQNELKGRKMILTMISFYFSEQKNQIDRKSTRLNSSH